VAYGLEHEPDLERYFLPTWVEGRLVIRPRLSGLVPLTSPKLMALGRQADNYRQAMPEALESPAQQIAVIGKHKYYRHVRVDLIEAGRTKAGKLKPPFTRVAPLSLVASARGVEEAKFYAAIASIQQLAEGDRTASDLAALRTMVKNGDSHPFYFHDDLLGDGLSSR